MGLPETSRKRWRSWWIPGARGHAAAKRPARGARRLTQTG
jgi:hypothetical protein